MLRILLLVLVLPLSAFPGVAQPTPPRIDAYTAIVLSAFEVPGANVALTHARVDGVVRPIAPFTSDNTNPAGGINASARDIAKWMIVQLDSGRVAAGERLFSTQTARELRADAFITFALNPDGSIDQAKMQAVSPATDFSFDFQDLLLVPARGANR